jgi:hypothetical protein
VSSDLTIVLNVPVFAADWRSLREALDMPGGLAVTACGLLSQGFSYSWLGALVIVLTALGLSVLTRLHYLRAGLSSAALWAYLPAILVFMMYNRHDHPLAACLTLSLGLLSSWAFEKLVPSRIPLRLVLLCLVSGLNYWLAGTGAAGIFACMTVVYLLFRRAWLATLVPLPATAGVIWLLADYAFDLSPKQAFLTLTPFCREWTEGLGPLSQGLVVLLFAFVPVTMLFLCLWHKMVAWKGRELGKAKKRKAARSGFLAYGWRLALSVAPLAVLAVGLYGSYDKVHNRIVTVNALAERGHWAEVLQCAGRLPGNVYSIYVNHDIDRALYHTGRLGHDLFCFPQNPHALLLTHEADQSCVTQLKMCDTFLELGNVDLAEKLASEFLLAQGHLPRALEKLAWINIIKGQDGTARVYLRALKKDFIYRHTAEALLQGLDHGFGPEEAAYIRRINSCIRRQDTGRLAGESIEEMLTGLVAQNPSNRMAFEYLMAAYLLAGQVDKITANAKYLAGLEYREIPTLYEEAMLIYSGSQRQSLHLGQLTISPKTIERYDRFVRLHQSLSVYDRDTAFRQLIGEFGSTYLFYYAFTISRPAPNP